LTKANAAMKDFDEHLSFSIMGRTDGTEIRIMAPGARVPPPQAPPGSAPVPPPADGSQRLSVDPAKAQATLIEQARPVYPPLAKEARIQGVVRLNVVIGKDGGVQNLSLVSGHPLLAQAALEAVRQWKYQPTLLNGNPVEVATQVDLNFALPQN
jgi:protein TonB